MKGGRPLRFLLLTLGGWTAMRALMLLPTTRPLPALPAAIVPRAIAEPPIPQHPPPRHRRLAPPPSSRAAPPAFARSLAPPLTAPPRPRAVAAIAAPVPAAPPPAPAQTTLPPPLVPTPIARGRSRLAGSAWLLARSGRAAALDTPQLGASQAGLRLTYALGTARRIALAARLSAPMKGRGREAALGLDWQPSRLPLHLLAEHRVSLDGGRGGPMLGLIGGYGPADIAPGVRLEAYGQAGAIARDGVETFIDTAARLTHPVAHVAGQRIDLGLGAWASAQRGARRADIGPTLGAAIPLADTTIRLTLDWRQRIGGEARPGSGPALSLGSDF